MIDDLIVELEWVHKTCEGAVATIVEVAVRELKALRTAGDAVSSYAKTSLDGDSKLDVLLSEWDRVAHG